MQEQSDEGETLYASSRHLFTVRRIDNRLVLTVICGTVGLSMAHKELTPEEIDLFNKDPERLADAARDLCEALASGGSP